MNIGDFLHALDEQLRTGFSSQYITTSRLASTYAVLLALSIYIFFLYRFTTKKAFYSKYFNITIAVIPFLISAIILTLQSSLLITLGTVGALAIIRYRTAIKDPMDMLYLFWSVHNGIVCGSGLFKIALLTNVTVSILIIVLDKIPMKKAPYLLVVHSSDRTRRDELIGILKASTKHYKIRSQNYAGDRMDLVIEIKAAAEQELVGKMLSLPGVEDVSLISHEGEAIA